MKIAEVMTGAVVSVSPETPLKEVAALLVANEISGVPVCAADGSVIGVVSVGDIVWKELGLAAEAGLLERVLASADPVTGRTADPRVFAAATLSTAARASSRRCARRSSPRTRSTGGCDTADGDSTARSRGRSTSTATTPTRCSCATRGSCSSSPRTRRRRTT